MQKKNQRFKFNYALKFIINIHFYLTLTIQTNCYEQREENKTTNTPYDYLIIKKKKSIHLKHSMQ